MTDSTVTKDIMLNICKYGTYYNPATKHYNTNATVVCDRCFRSNLDSCIGWQTYDLCLLCVHAINSKSDVDIHQPFYPHKPIKPLKSSKPYDPFTPSKPYDPTKPLKPIKPLKPDPFDPFDPQTPPDPFKPPKGPMFMTNMMQGQFRDKPEYITHMLQYQYRNEPKYVTQMRQGQFRNEPKCVTEMQQGQFRRENDGGNYKTYMMQSQFR